MKVKVVEYHSFQDFLNACIADDIRIVKMASRGFVAPIRKDGQNYMQGQMEVCLTAVSGWKPVLKRWTWTDKLIDQDLIRDGIMIAGIVVVDGKWEEKDVERVLGKEKT